MFKELDFPVQLIDIPHPLKQGTRIPDRKAVIRTDTDEVLNIVSDRYQLVRHVDVFNAMEEAVNRLGIPVKNVEVSVGDRGGLAKVTWRLDRTLDIGNGGGPDNVDLRLIARNSYNYMSLVGLQLGAFRLICSNGLMIGRMIAKAAKRHVPSLKVEAIVRDMAEMIAQQEKVRSVWKQWDHIEYLPPRLSKWLEERKETVSKKARESIVEYFQTQPDRLRAGQSPRFTGWEAYNSLTWYGTHRVQTRSQNRVLVARELVDQVAEEFAVTELKN